MADMKTLPVPYSNFLRGPNDVLPALDEGDVVLERRDDENLVLTTLRRFSAREAGTALATHLVADIARENPGILEGYFERELPWLHWLPDDDRALAVKEIFQEMLAGAETGLFAPFSQTLVEWRDTAMIWSDPELARRLASAHPGDGPEITRPSRAK